MEDLGARSLSTSTDHNRQGRMGKLAAVPAFELWQQLMPCGLAVQQCWMACSVQKHLIAPAVTPHTRSHAWKALLCVQRPAMLQGESAWPYSTAGMVQDVQRAQLSMWPSLPGCCLCCCLSCCAAAAYTRLLPLGAAAGCAGGTYIWLPVPCAGAAGGLGA